MNLLGLGFFGMAVKNFFSGLLRPAMEAVGLFDLFGATLQVVFLPIVMALLDLLLPVFEWLMNLSDATKLLIGKWVLFGLGAGFVLMVVGFLLSGLASLIFIFGGLFALLKAIIPEIILFGVNISSIIETLLGIAIVKTVWDFFSNIIGKLWEQFKKLDFVIETMAHIKGVTEGNIPIFDKLTAKADGLFKQFKDKIPLIWAIVSFTKSNFLNCSHNFPIILLKKSHTVLTMAIPSNVSIIELMLTPNRIISGIIAFKSANNPPNMKIREASPDNKKPTTINTNPAPNPKSTHLPINNLVASLKFISHSKTGKRRSNKAITIGRNTT